MISPVVNRGVYFLWAAMSIVAQGIGSPRVPVSLCAVGQAQTISGGGGGMCIRGDVGWGWVSASRLASALQ